MNSNEHYFTGKVEYAKERRISGQSWGSINVRVLLNKNSFDFRGETKIIPNSIIWVNIKVDYDSKSLKPAHKIIFDMCQTNSYIFVNGAKITDYQVEPKDENGNVIPNAPKQTRYNIEVNASGVSCSQQPYRSINLSVLEGYVKEVTPQGMLKLKIPYISKSEVKHREACVLYSDSNTVSLLEKKVFVSGSIFGKTPDRLDLIYVASDFLEITR